MLNISLKIWIDHVEKLKVKFETTYLFSDQLCMYV